MGAGTLIELIARGNQDTYLIGNPQFSYFKSVYKRCTNFSIEPIKQMFSESPDFGKRVTCIIDKKGDLLSDILLEIYLPPLKTNVSWTNGIGNFMIEWVELQLGGEPIDRITGDMLDTWMELTTQLGTKNSVYSMISKSVTFNTNKQTGAQSMLVPLPFWFCRSVERALPLIAMQYTDVKIVVQFKQFSQCWFKNNGGIDIPDSTTMITKAGLICNYIFLDVFERTKFAKQEQYEYLIEQFQQSPTYQIPANILSVTTQLVLNHPVKELFWTYRSGVAQSDNDYTNYANVSNYGTQTQQSIEPFTNIHLRFNGNDRFEPMPATFFRLYQPYRHHSCGTLYYIYMYSFALDPENMQPSGSCNFSKIDNATLEFYFTPNILDGYLSIYATNYNILRIKSGMCGIMFS
jgi:hypothetical protein